MRRLTLFLVALFCVLSLYGQKKKSIQQHRLKAITVYNQDFVDGKGKPIKESFTKYDELGNVIEEIEYDDKGEEKKHVVYEYDDEYNRIKETYLNPKGAKEKIIEFKYQDGLKTEKIVYLPNGKIKSKKKYVYDYH
jgi:hypothetical protein